MARTGRIPLVTVAGTNGKTTTVRLIAHILGCSGLRVGMTNSDGVYIEGKRIDTGDCSGPKSARNVLLHPDVDAAVLETARGGVLREGLAFDVCDVAVVTNIGMGDHLGLNYISTVEDLAVVKRVVVQNVAPHGTAVLNAADPMCVQMADACPGKVTFFARDRQHPVIATRRAQGHRVVLRCRRSYRRRTEFRRIPHPAVRHSPDAQRHDRFPDRERDGGGGCDLGLAGRLGNDTIRSGIVHQRCDKPLRVDSISSIIAAPASSPTMATIPMRSMRWCPPSRAFRRRKRVVVISGAGDRRDVDIIRQTEILGDVFDEIILYQDQCQRGRENGEVLALLRQGLTHAKRAKHIDEITGEFLAIDTALARLEAGDLCLILIDQVEEALEHIAKRVAGG